MSPRQGWPIFQCMQLPIVHQIQSIDLMPKRALKIQESAAQLQQKMIYAMSGKWGCGKMTINSNVTWRSSFLETEAYAGDESLPLAQSLRRGETGTAKRKRQGSEDEEDTLPVKEARIMLEMANKNVTSVSKESEGTSTTTASTSHKMMPNVFLHFLTLLTAAATSIVTPLPS